jgi:hypothetical protein
MVQFEVNYFVVLTVMFVGLLSSYDWCCITHTGVTSTYRHFLTQKTILCTSIEYEFLTSNTCIASTSLNSSLTVNSTPLNANHFYAVNTLRCTILVTFTVSSLSRVI